MATTAFPEPVVNGHFSGARGERVTSPEPAVTAAFPESAVNGRLRAVAAPWPSRDNRRTPQGR
ncbi:hypothetical protein, partial [Streptomyces clavuligerus]|uniref:hypothetical protein n=1 Tax=Streptomyces clavuligerus TaxID=1901 RepID=UPI001F462A8A